VGPHAVIEAEVEIGARCVLHAGAFIGRQTTLGDDCVIWPHAVIREGCSIGNRVIIHPNAVIGADGFGYYFEGGRHVKVPHIGGAMLGDDVEVGACACIDRAKFGVTIVGYGTKIDNLVQIAHNVRLGSDCLLAGQAGIGGSTRTGKLCAFGGQSGTIDNLTFCDNTRIGAASVVTRDVREPGTYYGWPAQDVSRALRTQASLVRLPELTAQVKELRKRVEELEATAHNRS
jgi:UDP-3-O-[3-hydroxymyristoyl] glucosamine N-acyltransferase